MANTSSLSSRQSNVETSRRSKLTQSEQLLLAFYRVANASTAKVPYEELVIQAWRDFPETFSLRNHPEHPDASDIHKRLYQSLKVKGQIVPLGNKIFRLTEKGIDEARRLIDSLDDKPQQSASVSRLTRSQTEFVRHAKRSEAFRVWAAGERDIIDYDAMTFLQFSTATSIQERQRKLDAAILAVARARDLDDPDASSLHSLLEHLKHMFPKLFSEGV